MNVSGLSSVSNKLLGCWDSYKLICYLIRSSEVYCICGIGLRCASLGSSVGNTG